MLIEILFDFRNSCRRNKNKTKRSLRGVIIIISNSHLSQFQFESRPDHVRLPESGVALMKNTDYDYDFRRS